MKEVIINLLSKASGLGKDKIRGLIEIPPSSEMGDYAFPCFSLAKELKKNPVEIAKELAKKIENLNNKKSDKDFEIRLAGAYINFFINKSQLAEEILSKILKEKEKFGKGEFGKNKKIALDMSSPNIAKPFGIGHLRSTIIGGAIANICEFQGFKTIRINYLGDWGTQFGKLIFGYKKWGSEAKLKKDPIKHLLEIYVKANEEEYEEEGRKHFKKLEDGDKESLKLWKLFKDYSLKEFKKIYSLLGAKFDVFTGESDYNDKMAQSIKELKNKGLLKQDQGAQIVKLEDFNLGVALIQKSDGAKLYVTRDLAAAIDRYKKYNFYKLIYEVGKEQQLHFKQLFKILELLGHKWAKDCIHVAHGLYLDKDGKKFSTRKGKVVFMADILDETISLVKEEIKKRFPELKEKQIDERALKIARAAIIYGDLKNNPENDMVFDLDRFILFEGDTGPYLQYSYARASSIIKKAGKTKKNQFKIKGNIMNEESELIKLLGGFPDKAKQAYEKLDPSIIAHYSFQLAQKFNEFYHACPVIGNENEPFRIALVEAFRYVMKNSLGLLGIEALDEM